MKVAHTPLATLAVAFGALLAILGALIWLAQAQPFTGLVLAVEEGGLVVRQVAEAGPADTAGVRVGERVVALAGLPLLALDLTEEPDTLRTYEETRRLYARQGQLHAALRGGPVVVEVQGAERLREVLLQAAPSRPINRLPPAFWLQLFVGVGGVFIGTWVWSLRRGDAAAQLTAVAGVALAVMVFPAAIYSTRDLALPPDLFRTLAAIDHYGAFAFGVAMLSIFYIYPRRIVRPAWLMGLAVVMSLWWVADTLRLGFAGPPTGFHLPAFLMLLIFLPAAAIQHRLSRNEPDKRAALRWFTLAVAIGTGTFVALVVVPNLFGFVQFTSQANAFLLLLIVFAGIGLSVARYRLFELEHWAFGLLFNLGAVAVIFGLDAVLIYALAVNRTEALSIALLAVLLAYLPLRDRLRRRFSTPDVERGALFQQVVGVALSPPDQDQDARWADLLRRAYSPLHLERRGGGQVAQIVEGGLGLSVPSVGPVGAVLLTHAQGGRRLFTRADEAMARELCAMLEHALESRYARETGVAEERARIARDMHDNIGAKLLSALHHPETDRKDTMIRDALSDFRAIINDATASALCLDEALADLRAECADRLDVAGMTLDWQAEEDERTVLSALDVHTFRSILREAVSNVLRHAGATHVAVRVRCNAGRLELSVQDNGRGFVGARPGSVTHGHGLTNIRTRLEALNGELQLDGGAGGVQLRAAFSVR